MSKLSTFLSRIIHGEDVVLVSRTKGQWERQFAEGKWDRLKEGQANTTLIAELISDYARARGETIRVLDVGCGNGGLARLVANMPGVDYTGIDLSETAIEAARAFVPKGTFLAADAEHPPEDLGVFDVLVFNEVFFYIDPDCVLPQYRSHVAPGAHVIVSVVRSWRTLFVFLRMRHALRIETRLRAADPEFRWDIAVGHLL
jgi:2-polyprenyl-3-methyl-5-hydroxy-6-metoxy-1,4-benzoquinol methylase